MIQRYTRHWAAAVDYLMQCEDCGAVILDLDAHDRWHTALADIWVWVDRVSGSSCEAARDALINPERKP